MKRSIKISVFILILVMSFLYLLPSKTIMADTDYSYIRVKLSISQPSVSIEVDGEYIIDEDPSIDVKKGDYTLTVSGSKVNIKGKDLNKSFNNSITFTRLANKGSGNNHIKVKGTKYGNINYLGNFKFIANDKNLLVVNHIPLEEYLNGVVAYEMSNSFPIEALKAQAVCARGYAVKTIKTTGTYDIGDTDSDQVYKGHNPNYKNVSQAVNETKGQVLTYDGKIISTYYAASNGGYTELPGNTWGGGDAKNKTYPYLVLKKDPYDLENPSSSVQKIFIPTKVVGSEYDAVESQLKGDYIVQIVNVNKNCNIRSGPGTNYSIIGTADLGSTYSWIASTTNSIGETWHKVDFKGVIGYVRSDLGKKMKNGIFVYENPVLTDFQNMAYEQLKNNVSNATDIKILEVNNLTNDKKRWPDTESPSYVTAKADIKVAYQGKDSLTLNGVTLQLMNPSGDGYKLAHDYLNSNYRLRGVEPAKGGFNVYNRRWGHGIGMSQRGAQQMASAHGWKHSQILGFYFEGTKLSNIDTSIPDLPLPTEVPKLSSSKYRVEGDGVTGLSTDLKASDFISNLKVENGNIRLVSNGGKMKSSGVVVTGDKVELRYSNNTLFKSYPIIIYGDVNGDGKITLIDLLIIKKHLLNSSKLTGIYFKAGDISKDNCLSLIDLLMVKKQLLGAENIKQ